VLTTTHPIYNGEVTSTFSGTYVPITGETREDVYKKIYKSMCERIGHDRPSVVFFSLERNDLSAA
jgi:hypothetical protein